MKILIDINHPAHVHFFKNFIWEMKSKGNDILVVASQKDVNLELLKLYNIDYINIGSYGKSLFRKFISFFILDIRMILIVRKFNPDLIIGICSIRGSHAGWLLNRQVFIFTDTECATEQIKLYKPFSTKIFTPECFFTDLGGKQIRYNGYHELAYLHPNRFKPNVSTLKNADLEPNEKFFVVRFVSWEATHDLGEKGFSLEGKRRLINLLSSYGRVIIFSESKLPEEFQKYQLKLPPTCVFDILYYASFYIGEGATMASEAAMLGTPSIFINSQQLGYLIEQEKKYGIQINCTKEVEVFSKIEDVLDDSNFKNKNLINWKKMIDEKIDVTRYLVDIVSRLSKK